MPVDFSPVYGTLNENKLIRAQNQEDTDTVTVYLSGKQYNVAF